MAEKKSNDPIIVAAREFFEASRSHESKMRERWADDLRFWHGEQWSAETLRVRQQSAQQGVVRPALVFDQTCQYVRQVVNDARLNPPALRAQPADERAAPEVADALQGLFRHIERVSRAQAAYLTALEWAVVVGRGAFRVYSELVDKRRNLYEPRIGRIANPLMAYFDEFSVELDGSDSMDAMLVLPHSRDAFKQAFPKAEATASWDVIDDWHTSDTIMVAEWHSVREVTQKIALIDDDTEIVLPDDPKDITPEQAQMLAGGYREEAREQKVCTIRTLSGVEELKEAETFHAGHVGLIPVYGNERYTDNERDLFGLIRLAKDPQRLLNYFGSNMAEAANGQTRSPWLASVRAVAGLEDQWNTAANAMAPTLLYNDMDADGAITPPVRNSVDLQLAGYANLMQVAASLIQSSLGMYQAAVGAPSNEKSGVAIRERKSESDVSTYHYISNLGESIQHGGRIIMEMLPRIMDTQRVQRILGEDGTPELVRIDPAQQTPFRQGEGPQGKAIKVLNPNIGRYDVHVTIGPSFSSRRQETADRLGDLLARRPELFGIIGDLFLRNQDWPGADVAADRVKAMLPPPVKALEEDDGVPAEVKDVLQTAMQAFQQREQAVQQGMQVLEQRGAEIQKQTQAATMDRAQAQVERARLNEERTRLEAERELLKADKQMFEMLRRVAAQEAARQQQNLTRAAQDGARQITDAAVAAQEPPSA